MTIETSSAGDVLGWSWLFRPTAGTSTRARSPDVRATAFDGACLRGKCDDDPALGYDLMKRFAQVLIERLQWTRLRLLDLYGSGRRLTSPPRGADGAACRSRSRRAARDARHLDAGALEPLDGEAAGRRARPVRDGLRLRDRRGADLGERRHRPPARRPDRARGRRGHRGDLRERARRRARRARPVRERGGRSPPPGADVVVVAGGIGLAPLRPVLLLRALRAARYGEVALLYGARTPADLLYRRRARALARGASTSTSRSTPPTPAGAGKVGVVPKLLDRRVRPGLGGRVRLRPRGDDALRRPRSSTAASPPSGSTSRSSATCAAGRPLRPLPARPDADLPGRRRLRVRRGPAWLEVREL